MPLFKALSTQDTHIWIWKYTEDEKLIPEEICNPIELENIQGVHLNRRAEMLSVRKILCEFLPHHQLRYRESGEPYLEPHTSHISISHTFPYAAVATSPCPVGIDMEKVKPKILSIEHKFILHEHQFLPLDKIERMRYLTAIWCVKEALYKLHHAKFWSLKKHYEVYPFELKEGAEIACRIYNEAFSESFKAFLQIYGDFMFVVVKS